MLKLIPSLFFIVILVLSPANAVGQQVDPTSSTISEVEESKINAWLADIEKIEVAMRAGDLQASESSAYRSDLNSIRTQAQALGDNIRDEMERIQALLQALAIPEDKTSDTEAEKAEPVSPPANPIQQAIPSPNDESSSESSGENSEGSTRESSDSAVLAQQEKYEAQKAFLEDQLSKVELILTLSKQLDEEFLSKQAQAFIDTVFDQLPHPLVMQTWSAGINELKASLAETAEFVELWWSEELTSESDISQTLRVSLVVITLLLTVLASIWIQNRCLPARTIQPASRLIQAQAAATRLATNSILPICALLVILEILTLSALTNDHGQIAFITGATYGLCFLFGALGLIGIAVSPRRPGWAYLSVTPNRGWHVYLMACGLAALAAFDLSVEVFFATANVPEAHLRSLYFFVTNLTAGAMLILLLRSGNWVLEDVTSSSERTSAKNRLAAITLPVATTLRRVISVAAMVAIAAMFIGYVPLGDYIIGNTVVSLLIILAGMLIHLLIEDITSFSATQGDEADEGTEDKEPSSLAMWFQLFADGLILIGAVAFIAIEWGFPKADLTRLFTALVQGFEVGDTRISLVDIGAGIAIFSAILIATRLTQTALETKVFKASSLDTGVQDSIQTVVGYLGLILAALFGVGAIGFDLSSLALIAGALSVGIGFGLQTTVSNFVAGLILLLERPVKVGDLIVVDEELGTINKINARATEIITLDKASVIVPNESLVASKIRNLTHKDRLGRLNIPVGVAYGSDTNKVKQCLLEAASEHPDVSKSPEPQVLFTDFGSSSLDMELRAYTADITDGIRIRSDLRFAIDAKFREHDIEIPFPQRVIHTASGPEDSQEELEHSSEETETAKS